ncbi:hypothetical protein INT43_000178 [Umbelopsis isabellina]|uniref:BHLH domain-containing protein n=1 Tax=Mortierella isabellina TaxID=91625 RepID=A0A8H7PFB3_MORIS|nr:hypothetical protein INT43_000178 [Umbelopsis isabellina]
MKVVVPSSYHPTYEQLQHSVASNIDPNMVTKVEHGSPPHLQSYAEGDALVDSYADYSFTHGMTVPMAVAYAPSPATAYSMPTARASYAYVSDKPIHPGSPESTSTTSTPHTPPLRAQASNESLNQAAAALSYNSNTAARVKETIAKASAVPLELYHTEFLTYSKEAYERKNDNRKVKRKRSQKDDSGSRKGKKRSTPDDLEDDEDEDVEDEDLDDMSNAELRRQIHIQSEQKRRAQIKDGFEELKKHLPGCQNKKMSKAAMLTRTVQQIQHLKRTQDDLLVEVERLVAENESLKKFQQSVLHRQAMEKMYAF